MTSLPPHYRQVIALRIFDDLAFAEVARRMGRTIDSVEKLWRRALERLRKVLVGIKISTLESGADSPFMADINDK